MIVSITGTPGTGKTEVAKRLAQDLHYRLVDLNKLAEEKGLYSGFDEKRNCKIVDIDGLAREVKLLWRKERIAQGGKANLVLDGHFSHDMKTDLVVVLRTQPKVLRERLQAKGWTAGKVEENVQAEIMEVIKQEAWETGQKMLEIDTTGKKPEHVVKEIEKAIQSFQ